ncbi:MAG: aldehyde dehydrogenase [Deltaproteobacteria bacterium]|nr:aldehyde dehydrogenase [Deltaproteobacteria bacterium]
MNQALIGSAKIPEAESQIPPTSTADLDQALQDLQANAAAWIDVSLDERIALLARLRASTYKTAERWAKAGCAHKKIPLGTPTESEEWLGGPFTTLRNLRLLERTLREIRETGAPKLPSTPKTRPDGTVTVEVFPSEKWDPLFYKDMRAEIWMDASVSEENLPEHTGMIYREKAKGNTEEPKVALVLGAGNVSSIGPMDAFYKLFCEDQVVALKMNPVNDYLGPFMVEALKELVDRGWLRVVYGGAVEGKYLCDHEIVSEIHITGSDKTHDAIVFGTGEEGARRKAERDPLNTKRITSELGNVSPVIVVPGPWSQSDLDFQGQNLASMLTNNAGFNCNATRVIITHEAWQQRKDLLDVVRATFDRTPTRAAYYPGAQDRMSRFVGAHPNAEAHGDTKEGHLPWTLIPDLDPSTEDEICFSTESWCSVFGEVALSAESTVEYIEKAVDFCNNRVWGTLNVALVVHPKTMKDPAVAAAVDAAISKLNYGSVAINHWPAVVYGLVTTTWGGAPGHTIYDVGSGIGVVHNTYLFDRPAKAVLRGPFRMSPKPPWFCTAKNSHNLAKKLTAFEAEPSWFKVPGIAAQALKG